MSAEKSTASSALDIAVSTISFLSNLTSILAASIAIYLFVCKRKELKSAFTLLMNWSFQLTLNDLRSKLERLNEYNANEPSEVDSIKNILHEVAGQIRGNRKLMSTFPDLADKFERLSKEPLHKSEISCYTAPTLSLVTQRSPVSH